MVLGIAIGCKVGTFHLGNSGSSHCQGGPSPWEMKQETPAPTRRPTHPCRPPGEDGCAGQVFKF